MTKLGVSAAAMVAGWMLAPFVSMRRRGTLDEQHSGELRLEALLAEAAGPGGGAYRVTPTAP